MKLKVILLALLGFVFFDSAAQEYYNKSLSIGAKGGVIMSENMFSPSVPQTLHIGPMVGFTVRYIEENHFGLIGEINYEHRGWKETFKETGYSYQRDLSYIQIPLLAHIFFGTDRARFFFNAGPEIGFMISEATKANFNIEDFKSLDDFPYTNRSTEQFTMSVKNKIDYGISAGLGAEVSLNRKHAINVEGRFYYGLNNIFSSNKKDTFAASNSIGIMVSLGYYFRIK